MGSRSNYRRGFTLVELLTVVAILTLLIQLLLASVIRLRESTIPSQCESNLRQLSLAAQVQLIAHLHFGVLGFCTLGDAKGVFGTRHRGSWCFILLPYLESEPLWSGTTCSTASSSFRELKTNTCGVVNGPSWPNADPSPYIEHLFANIGRPPIVFRRDFADNIGTTRPTGKARLESVDVPMTRKAILLCCLATRISHPLRLTSNIAIIILMIAANANRAQGNEGS